jgi:hypothetical protein
MDFASLGVSVRRDGSVTATTSELDKFSASAQRAEIAAGKLFHAKGNKEARDYAATVAQATTNLRGFDAIAARAAMQAQHITQHMAKLSMTDLRADDIKAYGREMDDLRAKFNPMFAAQQRFRAVTDEISHAQRVGAISSREATDALMREQSAYEAATAAINTNTAAMQNNNAASRASGAQRANAVNLMYQGQDIAMMALLGQDPKTLALQQGLQVGGIFSQMGGGKAIVQGLTSAIGMMLNPLNVATILTIGLGAAGVQAFMNMGGEADKATQALESNQEKFERVLTGYARAKGIVASVFEAAAKLPQGVVMSDLNASLREQEKAAKDLNDRITRNNIALAESISFFEQIRSISQSTGEEAPAVDQAIKQIEMLRTLGVDASSTRAQLDAAATAAQELFNSTDDDGLKDMASDAGVLITQLLGLKSEALATGAALDALDRDIQIRISMSNVFADAMADINSLYMDPRDQFTRAREELKLRSQAAQESAQSMSELTALANDYERVLGSINAAEAVANERSGRKGAREQEKLRDAYRDLVRESQQYIAAQELEQRALFVTSEAASRMRHEQDLLNRAANDNIKLSGGQKNELMDLAAQMAAVEEATRRVTEIYNLGAGLTTGFFSDVTNHLREQASEWQNIGDVARSVWEGIGLAGANALQKIADKALENAAMGIWDMIFGGIMGGRGGNSLGGGWGVAGGFGRPGIFGIPGFANGTSSAPGGLAWVGERGPELVNLPRGSQVYPHQQSMAMAANSDRSLDLSG